MSVINNELTCLALTGCMPLNARRRSASCVVQGVQSDSTQLNSTQLDVVGVSTATQLRTQLNSTRRRVELCCYKWGFRFSNFPNPNENKKVVETCMTGGDDVGCCGATSTDDVDSKNMELVSRLGFKSDNGNLRLPRGQFLVVLGTAVTPVLHHVRLDGNCRLAINSGVPG